MLTYTWECPHCYEENFAEVDLGEHMVIGPDDGCSSCGEQLTASQYDKIYSDALEDAAGQQVDRAYEAHKDRELFRNL